jgi:zinc ribbon protein/uncharacterized protein DUF4282/uncharacterized protein DUF2510
VGDFLAFRKMITPYVIQIVFWIGLVAILVVSVGLISNDQPLAGLLILAFGALYWRIVCEFIIVFFRMNDSLTSIKAHTATIPPALASRGWTPEGGGRRTDESASVADPTETLPRDKDDADPAAVAARGAGGATVASIPEGWYDDPDRAGHTRWWDGTAWGISDDEHLSTASDAEIATPSAESPPRTSEEPTGIPTAVEPSAEVGPAASAGSPAPESGSPSPPARFCENCGAERSPGARFCTNCGHA